MPILEGSSELTSSVLKGGSMRAVVVQRGEQQLFCPKLDTHSYSSLL